MYYKNCYYQVLFYRLRQKRVPLSVNRTNQSFKMIAQTPNIINKKNTSDSCTLDYIKHNSSLAGTD